MYVPNETYEGVEPEGECLEDILDISNMIFGWTRMYLSRPYPNLMRDVTKEIGELAGHLIPRMRRIHNKHKKENK